jgi:hypothetical protein
MASDILYKKQPVPKAPRSGNVGKMTGTTGWRLVATKGQRRYFAGTLLTTFNFGKTRLAVFSVPK